MKQKLLLMLIGILLISNSTSAQDAKEAFHNYATFEDRLDDWFEDDEYMDDIRNYVFGELLPSMDSNSVAYIDTLFKYIEYVGYLSDEPTYHHDQVVCAQQAKRLALSMEGKKERYIKALQYEINTTLYWRHTRPCDEITSARTLLTELLDCYHATRRPTNIDYIKELCNLYYCIFIDEIYPLPDEKEADFEPDDTYVLMMTAFVWNDLLRWDDITAEEYDSICHNYTCYTYERSSCLSMYGSGWSDDDHPGCNPFRLHRYSAIHAYTDICRANVMLTQKTGSEDFQKAGWEYVEALLCVEELYVHTHKGESSPMHLMDTALVWCNNLMTAYPSEALSDDYFYPHIVTAICTMSKDGYTPEVKNNLEVLYAEAEKVQEDRPYVCGDIRLLQIYGELLNKNYAYAMQLLKQIKTDIEEGDYYYLWATSVVAGDKKSAKMYQKLDKDSKYYDNSWEYDEIEDYGAPYMWQLEKRFEDNYRAIYKTEADHTSEWSRYEDKERTTVWESNGDYEEYEEWIEYVDDVEIDGLYYHLQKDEQIASVIHSRSERPVKDNNQTEEEETEDEEEDEEEYSDEEDDEWGEEDGEYEEDYEEYEPVKPYNYPDKSIRIPATVKYDNVTYKVTEIESNAFADCESLMTVTIPKSVTYIGHDVFDNCESLQKIQVESGNKKYCSKNGVLFSKDMTTLIKYPSEKKETKYAIPSGVQRIGEKAFTNNSNLTSVTLPNSLTTISSAAFAGCDGLTSVTIPEKVTIIGVAAFKGCNELTSVVWNAIGQDDVVLRYSGSETPPFAYCYDLESFTFGDKVEVIPPMLCAGLSSLSEVTIPNSVRTICFGAFSGCKYIENLTIPNSVETIGEKAFGGISFSGASVQNVVYDGTAEGAPWGARSLNGSRTDRVIINGVHYSLDKRDRTATIVSPSDSQDTIPSVVIIPEYVELMGTKYEVTEIESDAFDGCNSLRSISIPQTVTNLGWGFPFRDCKNLQEIHIAEGNDEYCSIDGVLFSRDTTDLLTYPSGKNDAHYAIPNSVKSINNGAFKGCSISSVTIPNTVRTIGNSAFMACEKLTSVTIPESVESFGDGAFCACSNLRSVVWNAIWEDESDKDGFFISYFSYGSGDIAPFAACDNLVSFTFGEQVRVIPQLLCAGLSGLTELTIPNSVKRISYGAFSGCMNIRTLTVPNSVDSIMGYAFGGLNNKDESYSKRIPNVIYHGSASGAPWGAQCLNGYAEGQFVYTDASKTTIAACTAIDQTEITIPATITAISPNAFDNCNQLNSIVWLMNKWEEEETVPFYNISQQITSFTIGDNLTRIRTGLCYGMVNLSDVTIPANITQIGEWAFTHCYSMTSATIPAKVKEVGAMAFYDCYNLEYVICLAETPPAMGTTTFEDDEYEYGVFFKIDEDYTDIPLYVPAASVEAYRNAEQWKDFKNILPLPNE